MEDAASHPASHLRTEWPQRKRNRRFEKRHRPGPIPAHPAEYRRERRATQGTVEVRLGWFHGGGLQEPRWWGSWGQCACFGNAREASPSGRSRARLANDLFVPWDEPTGALRMAHSHNPQSKAANDLSAAKRPITITGRGAAAQQNVFNSQGFSARRAVAAGIDGAHKAQCRRNVVSRWQVRKVVGWIVGLCVVLAPTARAAANPFEMYGAGGRAAAMAGAQTASARGAATIFYNLGALALAKPGVSGGFIAGINRSRILLMERPAGYDVPDLGSNSPAVPSGSEHNARSDTTHIDPLYAFTLGAVTSLGFKNFRAGVLLVVPSTGYVDANTYFVDERERIFSNQLHFAITNRRVRRMDLELGVAYKVANWLSAGLGASFSPGSAMNTSVFIPDVSNQGDVDVNSNIDTESNWGLNAGVLVDLTDNLHLGVQYRNEVYFRIHGQNNIRLGTSGGDNERVIQQVLDWTPSYSPDTLTTGLSWQFGRSQLVADARYQRWSDFRDTHSHPTDFHDTVSPRLGYEYDLASGNHLRAGAGWEPTPVPDQTGRTNYVDNDRVLASVGASYKFNAFDIPLQLDWAVQFQWLVTRVTYKKVPKSYAACTDKSTAICDEVPDNTQNPRTGQPYPAAQGLQTGNPGFPGFTSGGWLGAVVLDLAWQPEDS